MPFAAPVTTAIRPDRLIRFCGFNPFNPRPRRKQNPATVRPSGHDPPDSAPRLPWPRRRGRSSRPQAALPLRPRGVQPAGSETLPRTSASRKALSRCLMTFFSAFVMVPPPLTSGGPLSLFQDIRLCGKMPRRTPDAMPCSVLSEIVHSNRSRTTPYVESRDICFFLPSASQLS